MSKEIEIVRGAETASSSGEQAAKQQRVHRWRGRIEGFLHLFLRLGALAATVAAVITMATADELLSVFTQFFQFEAKYSDIPAFSYFVIANAIVGGYLLVATAVSVWNVVRPAVGRVLLMICLDNVMACLQATGAAAATAMVYLAHKGNSHANWFSICQSFGSFCRRTSGALIGSFCSLVLLISLVTLSSSSLCFKTKNVS